MSRGLNREQQAQLASLFLLYTDTLKPLLSHVESQWQGLPPSLLNEMRAFVDHLSRCYWEDATPASRDENLERAGGHLRRAILDCAKHLCVHYHDELKRFLHQYRNVDLSVVSDGEFLRTLDITWDAARDLVRRAKDAETRDKEQAFQLFQEGVLAYSRAHRHIIDNYTRLHRARARFSTRRALKLAAWLASAVLSGLAGQMLLLLF